LSFSPSQRQTANHLCSPQFPHCLVWKKNGDEIDTSPLSVLALIAPYKWVIRLVTLLA